MSWSLEAQYDSVCTKMHFSALLCLIWINLSRHIKKINSDGGLTQETTVAKIATVVNHGIRGEVEDELEYIAVR